MPAPETNALGGMGGMEGMKGMDMKEKSGMEGMKGMDGMKGMSMKEKPEMGSMNMKGKSGMEGMNMENKSSVDGMKGKEGMKGMEMKEKSGMEGMDHGESPKADPAAAKAVCDQIKSSDMSDPLNQALALKCGKPAASAASSMNGMDPSQMKSKQVDKAAPKTEHGDH